MKKIFLFIILIAEVILTNAQNPFDGFGYIPKIATLSKGKYNEFHDIDSIVQIGSVLFNTKSKQIVAFLQTDSLNSEVTLQPDIVSRWISPDPLSDERPGLSPYNYCQNNPIIFVDPDGRLDDYYLNLKSGEVEYHKGSENLINQGLVNIAGDNASVGDIQDALSQRNYNYQKDASVPGGFKVDTEKQYKGWELLQGSKTLAFAFGCEATMGILGVLSEGYSMYRTASAAKTINVAKGGIQLTKKTFGHTFTTHGDDMTNFLINRAKGSGIAQGQFLNNQKAAQFILDNVGKTANGAVNIPIPKGFPARVIMPDGTFKAATHIRLIPGGGGVKTAYPLIP